MAESEENLGTLNSTLDKLVDEVVGLRTELADLKRINTSVLQKYLVRKSTPKETHYLFYDRKRQKVDHENCMSWPPANGSGSPEAQGVFNYTTDVLGHYQNVDWPYELVDIDDFDPTGKHKHTNNLYFLEPQFIFTSAFKTCLNALPQEVQGWLRARQMALVFWFPHEGMNYYQGFHSEGWLHHFHQQMRGHQLETAICYLVFGDMQAEANYNRWLRTRHGMDKTTFQFTKVISYDYFHCDYWKQYSERTGVYVHRLQNPKYMHQNNYGSSELSGGFTDHIIIPYEDFDASLLERAPNQVIQDSYERCKPDEVLVGVPTGAEKNKDLICLNARPRSHRPGLVAELHRLGYTNDNSYISFLSRGDGVTNDGTDRPNTEWKQSMYNNRDISAFTARHDQSYISFFSYDVQREYVYKFWKDRDRVVADASPDAVDKDDRLIASSMYRDSFFSLVSETLFNDDPDALFLSEKIYKPIAYRHPFMVVGSMGTLRHLRYLGYQTFPEMFDESYDQEYDVRKRFDLIVKNLERWKQLSYDEKVLKYNSVRDKLKHNFEVFKNARGTFEKETVGVLSQLSSQSVDIHNV